MKKTSIYLSEAEAERLRRLAIAEGRSQAEIVRDAIASYESRRQSDRDFALDGSWAGDGTSVADLSEEELLRGFGS
jgi:predicted transcriptional regulator